MTYQKRSFLFLIIAISVTLFGCENKIYEQAKQQVENEQVENKLDNQSNQTVLENTSDNKFNGDEEEDMNKIIDANKLDQVSMQNDKEFKIQNEYHDPNEFARFVSDVLFKFYKLTISPEEYYDFILKYGSKATKEKLPNKEDAIMVYQTIQDMFKDMNLKMDSYRITNVILNSSQTEGYFYREVLSSNGKEYYICTIVKEDEAWKFVEDSPSPPFEETEGSNMNFQNN